MDGVRVSETLAFLVGYGYLVLFVWVLVEQLGIPLPSAPVLLAAGALAAAGRMSFIAAMTVTFVAALSADLFWYRIGVRHGTRFLGRLCRLSLEPDSCVRRSENFFARHGARSLLVAKFIPGLNAVAAPMLERFARRVGASWCSTASAFCCGQRHLRLSGSYSRVSLSRWLLTFRMPVRSS